MVAEGGSKGRGEGEGGSSTRIGVEDFLLFDYLYVPLSNRVIIYSSNH